MNGYRLTPAARQDLSSIWEYTRDRWDTGQAESYIAEIRNAVERVAADASRGHTCDEVREGYRRYAIGRHLIFYVERGGGIDVIRILHQRMDPARHI